MENKILSKDEIIKCNILQKDYKILSNIITKLQRVIIENEYILIYSKNSCMKNLNELIKKMNEKYNKSIIERKVFKCCEFWHGYCCGYDKYDSRC